MTTITRGKPLGFDQPVENKELINQTDQEENFILCSNKVIDFLLSKEVLTSCEIPEKLDIPYVVGDYHMFKIISAPYFEKHEFEIWVDGREICEIDNAYHLSFYTNIWLDDDKNKEIEAAKSFLQLYQNIEY